MRRVKKPPKGYESFLMITHWHECSHCHDEFRWTRMYDVRGWSGWVCKQCLPLVLLKLGEKKYPGLVGVGGSGAGTALTIQKALQALGPQYGAAWAVAPSWYAQAKALAAPPPTSKP